MVSKTLIGKYYIFIFLLIKQDKDFHVKPKMKEKTTIGIHMGKIF